MHYLQVVDSLERTLDRLGLDHREPTTEDALAYTTRRAAELEREAAERAKGVADEDAAERNGDEEAAGSDDDGPDAPTRLRADSVPVVEVLPAYVVRAWFDGAHYKGRSVQAPETRARILMGLAG